MVIGIVADASKAESLLDNLAEADFKSVSVIMSNVAQRNAIAKDAGPLKGVTAATLPAALAKAGLSKADAQAYANAVAGGGVLVAIGTPSGSANAAQEMLQDVSAQMVRTA